MTQRKRKVDTFHAFHNKIKTSAYRSSLLEVGDGVRLGHDGQMEDRQDEAPFRSAWRKETKGWSQDKERLFVIGGRDVSLGVHEN